MIGRYTHSPTSRIVFGDNIGTLKFSDQTIKFEGNADKSATILFDFVAKQFDEHLRNLIAAERQACIDIVEVYRIPVGNSPQGELAADWTYAALHEIRDEIKQRGEK